ncbi:hypothetical protein BMW23_0459 [Bodo saltans virus]|uniref:Uncharacterized protein n=1 Tax=Bodo saltans virus TaxID=2024608 RepID=A0A2H4UUA1_9VIRU|nr:hypothetical protein QJ851_gp0448 [Bodo saltans virus]ATZ80511.1 hypothetical protein BMW23_0459 [Bodo saltans virus]
MRTSKTYIFVSILSLLYPKTRTSRGQAKNFFASLLLLFYFYKDKHEDKHGQARKKVIIVIYC